MASTVHLRSTGDSGIAGYGDLLAGAGAVSGGTRVNTATAGSSPVLRTAYVTHPLAAQVTLAGSITFNIYAGQSASNENSGVQIRLFERAYDTGVETEILPTVSTAFTFGGGTPTECTGTTATLRAITGTPTSTVIEALNSLVVKVYAISAGGTLGSGTAYHWHDAPSSTGDSTVVWTETITYQAWYVIKTAPAPSGGGEAGGAGTTALEPAPVNEFTAPAPSGGGASGGVAATSYSTTFTAPAPTGGGTSGGDATTALEAVPTTTFTYSGVGGASTSGTAGFARIWDRTNAGGAASSGAAETLYRPAGPAEFAFEGTGGAAAGGTAAFTRAYGYNITGSGGGDSAGTAAFRFYRAPVYQPNAARWHASPAIFSWQAQAVAFSWAARVLEKVR